VVNPSAPRICWIRATRHPDCPASASGDEPTLLVVSDEEEFSGEAGALLDEMLHAIGFVRSSEPAGAASGLPGDASRVLMMGNDALQAVSDAGVDLQLIRGLWQPLSAGRGLATYAPSAVTDSPSGKRTVWNDLQHLLEDLSLEIPEWTRQKLKR
jgi:uracil-DNA glycosylase